MDSYINLIYYTALISSPNLSIDNSWIFCVDSDTVCEILLNHVFKKHHNMGKYSSCKFKWKENRLVIQELGSIHPFLDCWVRMWRRREVWAEVPPELHMWARPWRGTVPARRTEHFLLILTGTICTRHCPDETTKSMICTRRKKGINNWKETHKNV